MKVITITILTISCLAFVSKQQHLNSHFSAEDTLVVNPVNTEVNPLDTLEFDQIIAYNINYDSTNNKRLHFQMGSDPSTYNLNMFNTCSKRQVDSSLFQEILFLFSDTATYGEQYADCFEPRFVLQFLKQGKETFRIIICQDCGHLISTVPLPAAHLDYYELPTIPKNENESPGIWRRYMKGFSEKGAKQINELCRTLKMTYCKN